MRCAAEGDLLRHGRHRPLRVLHEGVGDQLLVDAWQEVEHRRDGDVALQCVQVSAMEPSVANQSSSASKGTIHAAPHRAAARASKLTFGPW